jgi:RTX calcium-binding nonapeptide repeat (4 copies)
LCASTRSIRGRNASSIVGSPTTSTETPALGQLGRDHLELGNDRHFGQRDHPGAGLELGEEEHLVDQLTDLLDLTAGLLDESGDVLAGKRGRLQQCEQAGERRPQLVRHRGREAGAQLLVRSEIALAAEVDQPLQPSLHLVRHDERNEPALSGEHAVRERTSLADPLDRLSSAPARRDDDVALVEDDDSLTAFLDECPTAYCVPVHHGAVLTEPLPDPCAEVTKTSRLGRRVGRLPHEKEVSVQATVRVALTGVAAALALAATASAAVIVGTTGDDRLAGTADADQIRALAGNDRVGGRGGGDLIRAGSGNDAADAGLGNDEVFGGRGNDALTGGAGDDRVEGGSGNDRLNGGGGGDRVAGGPGNDAVAGGEDDDSLYGGWGTDRVFGGPGGDRLHALAPDRDVDLLDCGAGDDTAIVRRSELRRTRLIGCEHLVVVEVGTTTDEAAENADTDADAE